jgi:hypothetical protein
MNLQLDANLSPGLLNQLRAAGDTAQHVAEVWTRSFSKWFESPIQVRSQTSIEEPRCASGGSRWFLVNEATGSVVHG